MPCNTVQTTTVNLQNANLDMLAEAVAALGGQSIREERGVLYFNDAWGYPATIANGEVTATRAFDASQLKRAYSAVVVKKAAKTFGWTFTQTKQGVAQFTRRAR